MAESWGANLNERLGHVDETCSALGRHRCRYFRRTVDGARFLTFRCGYRVLELNVEMDGHKSSLIAAMWCPTELRAESYKYGTGKVMGKAAPNAPVEPGTWPRMVFSHGYSGGRSGVPPITEHLPNKLSANLGCGQSPPYEARDEVLEVRDRQPRHKEILP